MQRKIETVAVMPVQTFLWASLTLPILSAVDLWLTWLARTNRGTFFFTPTVLFENTSIAFNLPIPTTLILPLIGIVVCVVSLYAYRMVRQRSFGNALAALAILTGGLSNVIDRLLWGSVTDIFVLPGGLFFNIADIIIVAGCVLWILVEYKHRPTAL